MLYNLHTHSHYCGHGSGEISEYAGYAASKGFSMLGFSEHCPFPDSLLENSRMPFSSMALYEDDVRRAGASMPFPVYLGYEIDYYDEYSSFFQSLSERTDFLIAGVHYVRRPDGTFRTPFNPGFSDDDVKRYADAAVKVMETGLLTFLAHPDVFLCRRHFDKVAEEAARTIASAAAELSVPLEVNGNGLLKGCGENEGYPSPHFWRIASEYVDSAVVSSDAHAVRNLDRTHSFSRAFAGVFDLSVLEPYDDNGRPRLRKADQS